MYRNKTRNEIIKDSYRGRNDNFFLEIVPNVEKMSWIKREIVIFGTKKEEKSSKRMEKESNSQYQCFKKAFLNFVDISKFDLNLLI